MILQFVPILLAGVAAVLIGFIWYSPMLFGNAFLRLNGMTPEMAEAGKRRMPLMGFFALLASMVVAFVMSYMSPALVIQDWIGAIELGLWCWIGFIAPVMLGMVLWERKPFRLYLIHSIHWLISLIVMALILIYSAQYLNPAATYDTGASVDDSTLME